jgi:hypothetical protein
MGGGMGGGMGMMGGMGGGPTTFASAMGSMKTMINEYDNILSLKQPTAVLDSPDVGQIISFILKNEYDNLKCVLDLFK